MLEESTGNFSATRNIYDWYQTNNQVIINVMIKNLKESDVRVKLIDETLDVTCSLADGSEFNLHFNLFKSIYVNESSWTVSPSKLEIKLKKTDRKRWQSLEVIPDKNQGTLKRASSLGAGSAATTPKRLNSSSSTTSTGSSPNWTSTLANNNISELDKGSLKEEPKASYDWYQTNTDVIINVNIANLSEQDVEVRMDENTLECCCNLPNSNQAKFHLNLNKPIIVNQSVFKLTISKLEFCLKKQVNGRWNALECDPDQDNDSKAINTTIIIKSSPDKNSSSATTSQVENEDEESSEVVEGIYIENDGNGNGGTQDEDGLEESHVAFQDKDLKNLDQRVHAFQAHEEGDGNCEDKLYREIFEKGGDEVRRAMMKKRLSETGNGNANEVEQDGNEGDIEEPVVEENDEEKEEETDKKDDTTNATTLVVT